MSRIKALNDESSTQLSKEDPHQVTREAQEDAAYRQYNDALCLQANGDDGGADILFSAVLQSAVVSDPVEPWASGMGRLLRYSCHKNLGSSALRRGEHEAALHDLLAAAALDDSDVTLWYKVGVAAYKAQRYQLARTAFKQGLSCSPSHWPCIDGLVSVLYLLNDFEECILRLSAAFRRDPHFTRGRALVDLMLKEQPSLRDTMKPFLPEGDSTLSPTEYDTAAGARLTAEARSMRQQRREQQRRPVSLQPARLTRQLTAPSWTELGRSLLALYKHICLPGSNLSLLSAVPLAEEAARLRRDPAPGASPSSATAARAETRRVTFEDESAGVRRQLSWGAEAVGEGTGPLHGSTEAGGGGDGVSGREGSACGERDGVGGREGGLCGERDGVGGREGSVCGERGGDTEKMAVVAEASEKESAEAGAVVGKSGAEVCLGSDGAGDSIADDLVRGASPSSKEADLSPKPFSDSPPKMAEGGQSFNEEMGSDEKTPAVGLESGPAGTELKEDTEDPVSDTASEKVPSAGQPPLGVDSLVRSTADDTPPTEDASPPCTEKECAKAVPEQSCGLGVSGDATAESESHRCDASPGEERRVSPLPAAGTDRLPQDEHALSRSDTDIHRTSALDSTVFLTPSDKLGARGSPQPAPESPSERASAVAAAEERAAAAREGASLLAGDTPEVTEGRTGAAREGASSLAGDTPEVAGGRTGAVREGALAGDTPEVAEVVKPVRLCSYDSSSVDEDEWFDTTVTGAAIDGAPVSDSNLGVSETKRGAGEAGSLTGKDDASAAASAMPGDGFSKLAPTDASNVDVKVSADGEVADKAPAPTDASVSLGSDSEMEEGEICSDSEVSPKRHCSDEPSVVPRVTAAAGYAVEDIPLPPGGPGSSPTPSQQSAGTASQQTESTTSGERVDRPRRSTMEDGELSDSSSRGSPRAVSASPVLTREQVEVSDTPRGSVSSDREGAQSSSTAASKAREGSEARTDSGAKEQAPVSPMPVKREREVKTESNSQENMDVEPMSASPQASCKRPAGSRLIDQLKRFRIDRSSKEGRRESVETLSRVALSAGNSPNARSMSDDVKVKLEAGGGWDATESLSSDVKPELPAASDEVEAKESLSLEAGATESIGAEPARSVSTSSSGDGSGSDGGSADSSGTGIGGNTADMSVDNNRLDAIVSGDIKDKFSGQKKIDEEVVNSAREEFSGTQNNADSANVGRGEACAVPASETVVDLRPSSPVERRVVDIDKEEEAMICDSGNSKPSGRLADNAGGNGSPVGGMCVIESRSTCSTRTSLHSEEGKSVDGSGFKDEVVPPPPTDEPPCDQNPGKGAPGAAYREADREETAEGTVESMEVDGDEAKVEEDRERVVKETEEEMSVSRPKCMDMIPLQERGATGETLKEVNVREGAVDRIADHSSAGVDDGVAVHEAGELHRTNSDADNTKDASAEPEVVDQSQTKQESIHRTAPVRPSSRDLSPESAADDTPAPSSETADGARQAADAGAVAVIDHSAVADNADVAAVEAADDAAEVVDAKAAEAEAADVAATDAADVAAAEVTDVAAAEVTGDAPGVAAEAGDDAGDEAAVGESAGGTEAGSELTSDAGTEPESAAARRPVKRKRNILDALKMWPRNDPAEKRRSKRSRSAGGLRYEEPTPGDEALNYRETFSALIPASLRYDRATMKVGDASPRWKTAAAERAAAGRASAPPLSEGEREDVLEWMEQQGEDNDGVVRLLWVWLWALERRRGRIWPQCLISLFTELYELARPHQARPEAFQLKLTPETAPQYLQDTLISLLYAELRVDRGLNENTGDVALETADEDLSQLGFLVLNAELLGEEQRTAQLRFGWCRHKYWRLVGDRHLAIAQLRDIDSAYQREAPGDWLTVRLPNCCVDPLLTAETVQQQLTALQRVRDLDSVQRLYDAGKYDEVVDVLGDTFGTSAGAPGLVSSGGLAGVDSGSGAASVPHRSEQLHMLLESLQKLERPAELAAYCEACVHESLSAYLSLDTASERAQWARVIRAACSALPDDWPQLLERARLCRLSEDLLHMLMHQLNSEPASVFVLPLETVTPWLLLHQLIVRESRPAEASGAREMPAPLRFLVAAHEALGGRCWCCSDEGALLHRCIDHLLPALDADDELPYDDELRRALEQCFFCLYAHPQRRHRAKHLVEHDVPPVPLTWPRAQQMYYYFCPCELPQFDSYRVASISADDEALLQRVMALVPAEHAPDRLADQIERWVTAEEGDRPALPTPLPATSVTKHLYYLVADFNFKNRQWEGIQPQLESLPYFARDVVINPERIDSWAAMALARASQVERELNLCQRPGGDDARLWRRVAAALRCYRRTLQLDSRLHKLWLEFGNFCYMLNSHANRLLRQESSGDLDLATFSMLETQTSELSSQARTCFTRAEEIAVADAAADETYDDRWLHHYMLGKMADKDDHSLDRVLAHYQKAHVLLEQAGVTCPRKISYEKPPLLALESLEVFYRVHATVLKYLLSCEGEQLSWELHSTIVWHLDAMEKSAWSLRQEPEQEPQKRRRAPSDSEDPVEVKRLRLGEAAVKCAALLSERILSAVFSEVGGRPAEAAGAEADVPDTAAAAASGSTEAALADVAADSDAAVVNRSDASNDITAETEGRRKEADAAEVAGDVIMRPVDEGADVNGGRGKGEQDDDARDAREEPVEDAITRPRATDSLSSAGRVAVADGDTALKAEPASPAPPPAADDSSDVVVLSDSDDSMVGDASEVPASRVDSAEKSTPAAGSALPAGPPGPDRSTATTVTSPVCKPASAAAPAPPSAPTAVAGPAPSVLTAANLPSGAAAAAPSAAEESVDSSDAGEDLGHSQLARRCIRALHGVLRHFPEHYKSLYRLAHYYFTSKYAKHVEWARDILMGCSHWQTKEHMPSAGLFAERKPPNLFHGIWRIPVEDIDRPGSFAAHMYRSASLLVEVLRAAGDFGTLLRLADWLRATPDHDKKYLRDDEREQLSSHAFNMALQAARATFRRLFKAQSPVSGTKRLYFLLDLHEAYVAARPKYRCKVAPLLEETYKLFRGGKVDPEPLLIQQAVRFCEAQQSAIKQAQQAKQQLQQTSSAPASLSAASRGSGVPSTRGRRGRPPGSGRGRRPAPALSASAAGAVSMEQQLRQMRAAAEAQQLQLLAQSTGLGLEQVMASQLARPADLQASLHQVLQQQQVQQMQLLQAAAAAVAVHKPTTAAEASAAIAAALAEAATTLKKSQTTTADRTQAAVKAVQPPAPSTASQPVQPPAPSTASQPVQPPAPSADSGPDQAVPQPEQLPARRSDREPAAGSGGLLSAAAASSGTQLSVLQALSQAGLTITSVSPSERARGPQPSQGAARPLPAETANKQEAGSSAAKDEAPRPASIEDITPDIDISPVKAPSVKAASVSALADQIKDSWAQMIPKVPMVPVAAPPGAATSTPSVKAAAEKVAPRSTSVVPVNAAVPAAPRPPSPTAAVVRALEESTAVTITPSKPPSTSAASTKPATERSTVSHPAAPAEPRSAARKPLVPPSVAASSSPPTSEGPGGDSGAEVLERLPAEMSISVARSVSITALPPERPSMTLSPAGVRPPVARFPAPISAPRPAAPVMRRGRGRPPGPGKFARKRPPAAPGLPRLPGGLTVTASRPAIRPPSSAAAAHNVSITPVGPRPPVLPPQLARVSSAGGLSITPLVTTPQPPAAAAAKARPAALPAGPQRPVAGRQPVVALKKLPPGKLPVPGAPAARAPSGGAAPLQQVPAPQQRISPDQRVPALQQRAPVPQQRAPVPQQRAPVPQQRAPAPKQRVSSDQRASVHGRPTSATSLAAPVAPRAQPPAAAAAQRPQSVPAHRTQQLPQRPLQGPPQRAHQSSVARAQPGQPPRPRPSAAAAAAASRATFSSGLPAPSTSATMSQLPPSISVTPVLAAPSRPAARPAPKPPKPPSDDDIIVLD